jgi:hypothetical protein
MITEEEIARLLQSLGTEEGRRVLAALAEPGGAEPDDSLPGAFVPEDAFTEGDLPIGDTDPISPTMDVPIGGPPPSIGAPPPNQTAQNRDRMLEEFLTKRPSQQGPGLRTPRPGPRTPLHQFLEDYRRDY